MSGRFPRHVGNLDGMLCLMASGRALRLIGAANVPSRGWLRVSSSWPSGVLVADGPHISLRVRWLGRFVGAVDLSVSSPSELRQVYLVDALALTGLGLGFQDHSNRDFYFWPMGGSDKARRVLAGLRSHGYEVDQVPRKARKRWQGVA